MFRLLTLHYSKNIDRKKLGSLIADSNDKWIPYYVKNLAQANLTGVDLTGANLNKANLSRANLNKVNLTKSQLSSSLLIGIREYNDLECNQAYFD